MKFNEKTIQAVWDKGRAMPDRNADEWRQDQCGAWLHRQQYQNEQSEYGWKILNVAAGGGDDLEHLRPFHYKNTFDIANGKEQCRITADRAGLMPAQSVGQPRNSPV